VQAAIDELRQRLAVWWGDESAHAPEYGLMEPGRTLPVPATLPFPPPGATGVGRQVDPRWVPSTAAHTQTVLLGPSPAELAPFAELAAMESSFNPGTLAPGTIYWWRVDGTNAAGTTAGEPWSFTTELGGPGGPGLASTPAPPHRALGMGLSVRLLWTPPEDALGQELLFGPEEGALLPFAGPLPAGAGELELPPLAAGVAYRWRVDTHGAEGTTEGTVWTFATDPSGLAQPAGDPLPPHLEDEAAPGLVLSWRPGQGALSHDVYFGTALPLPLVASQPGTSYDPGPLVPGQTYCWRVDEVNASGARRGWTWRFVRAQD
jgi:hypothetical protein